MRKTLFILLSLLSFAAFAQNDTAFWFAAPNITNQHDRDSTIYFRITTSNYNADVTISQPHNTINFPSVTNSMGSYQTWSFSLRNFKQWTENTPADSILNYGFYITSTAPVNAYYEKAGISNDAIFNLKGKNALGTEFYTSGQTAWPYVNWYYGDDYPERGFVIVATEDGTNVTITPKQSIIGHVAGLPFTKTLNRGQTYAAVRDTLSLTGFLEGSHIVSDKPIAVTLYDDSQIQPDSSFLPKSKFDLIGDQTFPVSVTGKEYIATKGKIKDRDEYIFITAIQNGTQLTINGITVPTILNAGDTYPFHFADALADTMFVHIKSNNKIYAYQVTGIERELTASILPPIDLCTGSTVAGFMRSPINDVGKSFFITLLIRSDPGAEGAFSLYVGNTLIPGAIPASAFKTITSKWKAAQIDLTSVIPEGAACRIENPNLFHLGIVNAASLVSEFGYFSDLNPTEVAAYIAKVDTNYFYTCVGKPIQLIAEGGDTYRWIDSIYLDDPHVATPKATFTKTDSVKYRVEVSGCNPLDTAEVTVIALFTPPAPEGQSVLACITDPVIPPITLDSNLLPGAIFDWYSDPGLTTLAHESTDTFYNTGNTAEGTYQFWVMQRMDTVCKSPANLISLTISRPLGLKAGTTTPMSACSDQLVDLNTTITGNDPGGFWVDTMHTGRLSAGIFNPSGIKGGTFEFVYTFLYVGCPVEKASVLIHTDSIQPLITCPGTIEKTVSLGNTYNVTDNEFNPISCSDNCLFSYSNDINNDSTLMGGVIVGSREITWTIRDSGLNINTCVTKFILKLDEIPNTITPNGDGHNDFFDVEVMKTCPTCILEIFDRWGKKIFVSNPGYTNKWYGTEDGSEGGARVPVDTYHYLIRDGDKAMHKGFISVVY